MSDGPHHSDAERDSQQAERERRKAWEEKQEQRWALLVKSLPPRSKLVAELADKGLL